MRLPLARAALFALAGTSLQAQAADPTFWFANTPYLSAADIPVGFYRAGGPTLLETFEDGSLDATLAGINGGIIVPGAFNGARDSVDGDDGVIDGTCGPQSAQCGSWFHGSGSQGVTFSYTGNSLPTAFGLVWTDGGTAALVTFSATGADGQLLGTLVAGGFGDNSNSATTAEDRFFGVTFSGGVKSIFISSDGGGIEIDHLQYGQMAAAVPEPGTWALLLGGGLLLGWRCRRA